VRHEEGLPLPRGSSMVWVMHVEQAECVSRFARGHVNGKEWRERDRQTRQSPANGQIRTYIPLPECLPPRTPGRETDNVGQTWALVYVR